MILIINFIANSDIQSYEEVNKSLQSWLYSPEQAQMQVLQTNELNNHGGIMADLCGYLTNDMPDTHNEENIVTNIKKCKINPI